MFTMMDFAMAPPWADPPTVALDARGLPVYEARGAIAPEAPRRQFSPEQAARVLAENRRLHRAVAVAESHQRSLRQRAAAGDGVAKAALATRFVKPQPARLS